MSAIEFPVIAVVEARAAEDGSLSLVVAINGVRQGITGLLIKEIAQDLTTIPESAKVVLDCGRLFTPES